MEYDELLVVAKRMIGKNHYIFDEYDIVHTAYIGIKNPDINHLKRIFKEMYYDFLKNNRAEEWQISKNQQTKVCSICKDDKPVAAFREIFRKKENRKFLNSQCYECERLWKKKYNKKKYEENIRIGFCEELKKRVAKSSLAYYHKNKNDKDYRTKIKENQKRSFENAKNNVTRGYIRHLLRVSGIKAKNITEEMITERKNKYILNKLKHENIQ